MTNDKYQVNRVQGGLTDDERGILLIAAARLDDKFTDTAVKVRAILSRQSMMGGEQAGNLLRKLVEGDAGQSVLWKLSQGQGVDTDDGSAWLAAKSFVDATAAPQAQPASPAERGLHHNFTTHRDSWRDAITEAINTAKAHRDHDNAAYWEHELRAYDEAFDSLVTASPQEGNVVDRYMESSIALDAATDNLYGQNLSIPANAAAANGDGMSGDIEQRTEKIRLAHANPVGRSRSHLIRDVEHLLAHIALMRPAAEKSGVQVDTGSLVDRFLGWKLPDDFSPDAGISFDHAYAEKWGMPIGTNLLHAGQAQSMFEYCLTGSARMFVKVTTHELVAFDRFCECAEDFDSGGYDVPKDMMKRLAAIGLVRPCGFGRYETTLFGDAVRNDRTPAADADGQKGSTK